ncbi:polyphosphate--glucose phosphotransferase [Agilicoccus flavus]|uniref:polyphosphate--glucose phosphotransferase n=1 Tax=Agilicoccus flavus TaxID=2775968 RepID=UPI001CF61053|nr:ROK family protein [Agilicoccus flavus]
MAKHYPLGIDVGGSGIKGAPVDLKKGEFAADRLRIETPEGASPQDVADVVAGIVEAFARVGADQPVGVTMPAVVRRGVVESAANIDPAWIGTDVEALMAERLGRSVTVLNDADAAGVAEIEYGAGRGVQGVVLVATLGTGIGSALFVDGILVPNTELGHLELDGADAETRAANSAREREDLSWEDWAKRLQRYFSHVEGLFSPDLIVIGGGVSKKADKYLKYLDLRTKIVPAGLLNDGGIIGAASQAVTHA